MKKNWLIIEKIIAVIEIISGGVMLYFLYESIINLVNILHYELDNSLILYLFKTYHFIFFTGLLTVFSGWFLLFNKRIGWITSLATLLIITSSVLIFILFDNSKNVRVYFFAGLISLILLTFFSLLLFKPFKDKYGLTKSVWLSVFIITTVFILDYTVGFQIKQPH